MNLDKLIGDLKRRRVFRVAGVYAVFAWACIQIADSTFPHIGFPEWATRAVIIIAAIGFPIALVLAWLFDVTVEGIKRTDDTQNILSDDAAASMSPAPNKPALSSFFGGRGAAQIGVGAVIALVAFGAYSHFNPGDAPATRAKFDSVAVLPFVDMSAAKDQEYFSDGISEELLNALAKVHGLRVPGRTSSFQFKRKGTDARTIGAQLGVVALLEGSVQKAGDKVRINAQLTDATTGSILWSEKYDRQLTDIFAVQDEITRAIVDALKLQMNARPGGDAPVAEATTNAAAHDAYLVGLFKLNRRTLPQMREAERELKKAIKADPKFAPAYAALADVFALIPQYGGENSPARTDSARYFAQEALRLDPGSAEAHAALGTILCYLDWKYADAERELKRAIELNPNYATAHQWYGELLMIVDRGADAERELRRAVALDPLSPLQHLILGRVLDFQNDPAAAEKEINQAIRIDSTFNRSYGDLISYYLSHDRFEDAAEAAARAARVLGIPNDSAVFAHVRGFRENPQQRAALIEQLTFSQRNGFPSSELVGNGIKFAFLGDNDTAFRLWNNAVDLRDPSTLFIKQATTRMPIQRDPRFAALMRRTGL